MFQFSIRTLFVLTTVAAIGLWTLLSVNQRTMEFIFTYGIPYGLLCIAIVGAVYLRGDLQAFAFGATLPLAGVTFFLISTFVAAELWHLLFFPQATVQPIFVALFFYAVMPVLLGFVAVLFRRLALPPQPVDAPIVPENPAPRGETPPTSSHAA